MHATSMHVVRIRLQFQERVAMLVVVACLVVGLGACSPTQSAHAQDATPPELIQQGLAKLQSGDMAGAETLFREAVTKDETSARGWYLLGYAAHAQQKWPEAIEAHQQAVKFDRTKPAATYNLACAYAMTGKPEEAFELLAEAIELGAVNRTQLLADTDWNQLRSSDRFQQLIPPPLSADELFVEPTTIIHLIEGEAANDEFGWVARRVGDVDEDGVADFVATAPGFGNGAGKIYVYSTRLGELLYSKTGGANDRLGNGAAGAGDVNGDGVPDVIVGAPRQSPDSQPGKALVLSGTDGELIWELTGSEPGERFGYKVSGIGDVDGDGHHDVAVSATGATGDESQSGCVYGFSGKSGEQLFRLNGQNTGDQYGGALAGNGSVTSPRLIIGAPSAGEQDRGEAYVFDFEDGAPQLAFAIQSDATNVNLGQMFASFIQDVDGDGQDEIYVSDFNASANGPGTGSVYLHSGATGERVLQIDGQQPGEGLGTSPSDAGDVDGDGHGDLIIGAWQNREGAPSGGKVTLFSGVGGKPIRSWTCRESGDTFGFDATGIGDVDGDGSIDFLLTSAWSSATAPKAGRVLVISGETE